MIKANPISLSTPTRFQASFELSPPYTASEIKAVGDGKWSAQCGVVELEGSSPVEYGSIYTEGAHNMAPHDGEPVPCVTRMSVECAATFDATPSDPDYPKGTYAIAMPPVPHGEDGHFDKLWTVYSMKPGAPHVWRVVVNVVHGTEDEVRDAHRHRSAGCLFPWWPLPLGGDQAGDLYKQMLRDKEISVGPERPAVKRKAKVKPAAKPAAKAKARPKK